MGISETIPRQPAEEAHEGPIQRPSGRNWRYPQQRADSGMSARQTQEAPALLESASHERSCDLCGEPFDFRYSRDGRHCFVCSVHATCACADDPE